MGRSRSGLHWSQTQPRSAGNERKSAGRKGPGYRITRHVSLFVGYTFLYWNNPIRAGDQVDLVVNANQTGPPSRPAIPFKTDAFWAQGVNVGLDLHW
jgi:hypothetical protein